MQSLRTFSNLLQEQNKDCNSVNTIQDINSQYTYEYTIGGGLREWDTKQSTYHKRWDCKRGRDKYQYCERVYFKTQKRWNIGKDRR